MIGYLKERAMDRQYEHLSLWEVPRGLHLLKASKVPFNEDEPGFIYGYWAKGTVTPVEDATRPLRGFYVGGLSYGESYTYLYKNVPPEVLADLLGDMKEMGACAVRRREYELKEVFKQKEYAYAQIKEWPAKRLHAWVGLARELMHGEEPLFSRMYPLAEYQGPHGARLALEAVWAILEEADHSGPEALRGIQRHKRLYKVLDAMASREGM